MCAGRRASSGSASGARSSAGSKWIPPAAPPHDGQPLLALGPRDPGRRRRPRAVGPPPRPAPLRHRRRPRPLPPVPRRPLPERHGRGCSARRRRGPAAAVRIGIVGLPNAGKSSLFNALTRAGAEVAGYAFTTVEPNVAVLPVPDGSLARVAETAGAVEVVYESMAS